MTTIMTASLEERVRLATINHHNHDDAPVDRNYIESVRRLLCLWSDTPEGLAQHFRARPGYSDQVALRCTAPWHLPMLRLLTGEKRPGPWFSPDALYDCYRTSEYVNQLLWEHPLSHAQLIFVMGLRRPAPWPISTMQVLIQSTIGSRTTQTRHNRTSPDLAQIRQIARMYGEATSDGSSLTDACVAVRTALDAPSIRLSGALFNIIVEQWHMVLEPKLLVYVMRHRHVSAMHMTQFECLLCMGCPVDRYVVSTALQHRHRAFIQILCQKNLIEAYDDILIDAAPDISMMDRFATTKDAVSRAALTRRCIREGVIKDIGQSSDEEMKHSIHLMMWLKKHNLFVEYETMLVDAAPNFPLMDYLRTRGGVLNDRPWGPVKRLTQHITQNGYIALLNRIIGIYDSRGARMDDEQLLHFLTEMAREASLQRGLKMLQWFTTRAPHLLRPHIKEMAGGIVECAMEAVEDTPANPEWLINFVVNNHTFNGVWTDTRGVDRGHLKYYLDRYGSLLGAPMTCIMVDLMCPGQRPRLYRTAYTRRDDTLLIILHESGVALEVECSGLDAPCDDCMALKDDYDKGCPYGCMHQPERCMQGTIQSYMAQLTDTRVDVRECRNCRARFEVCPYGHESTFCTH